MKLLLDEMLSPAIAVAMRSRGHDVEAIKEHPEWRGLSDPEVIDLAREQQRVIVTNNIRDFRLLHTELVAPGGPGHAGIIFLPTSYRLTRRNVGRLARALEATLPANPGATGLANGESWL